MRGLTDDEYRFMIMSQRPCKPSCLDPSEGQVIRGTEYEPIMRTLIAAKRVGMFSCDAGSTHPHPRPTPAGREAMRLYELLRKEAP